MALAAVFPREGKAGLLGCDVPTAIGFAYPELFVEFLAAVSDNLALVFDQFPERGGFVYLVNGLAALATVPDPDPVVGIGFFAAPS